MHLNPWDYVMHWSLPISCCSFSRRHGRCTVHSIRPSPSENLTVVVVVASRRPYRTVTTYMFSSFQDPGPVFPRHAPLAQSVGLDEWSPNGSTMYLVRYYLPPLLLSPFPSVTRAHHHWHYRFCAKRWMKRIKTFCGV